MLINNVLIVDDDRIHRLLVEKWLGDMGYTTEDADDGKKAITRLMDSNGAPIDLVLLDLFMPNMDGKETLRRIRESFPTLPVIIITADNKVDDAVALMKLGAFDFITKPLSVERLKLSIEHLLTIQMLSSELARLKRKETGCGTFADIIGEKEGLAKCVALGRKAARSDIPVLITGESGVGKEILARAIHGESARSGRPFVAINCGAIPENLVESTLFGHEKGSFTGAIAREIGKFREAEGGSLLLDEVGELKPDMQTKLLRVLQQKEIQPVGSGKTVKINVRILSATNRNLEKDVATGRFREDLYYRLNVLPIHVPPLRERRNDIMPLTKHILARFCASEQKPSLFIHEKGLKWLSLQSWPGNVRELENFLYRAVVLADKKEISENDLMAMMSNEPTHMQHSPDLQIELLDKNGQIKPLRVLESEIIKTTLHFCDGSIAETAKLLEMGQSTLYKRLSDDEAKIHSIASA